MARIPETELERIKTEVSLLRLVEAKGIVMKRHGKDWLGHCPFHDDKTPSLVVSPEKNLWHCLGACNTGGSVIDWVMKAEGVSFRHAVELLQQDFVPTGGVVVKRSLAPKLPTLSAGEQADDAALLGRVVDYYHQRLLQSEAGLAYLAGRGLNHPELIATFRLGFVDRTLGYYLPYGRCQEGQALRGQLQRLGVLRASGHEHFRGCVVVPVEDRGVIGEVYGRRIGPVKGGESAHYYLPGAHAGIWNRQALETHEEIILCESLLDAMSFWVNGYRNVTCSWGVNGFTDDHLSAFREHGIQRILIAYDRDEAGERAAAALTPTLQAEGIGVYRIQFPKGMDANEYALKVTPAHQSLGLAIRKAQWLRNGKAPAQLSASPALQLSAQSDTLPLDPPPSFLAAEVAAPLAADAAECSEKNATKTETLPAAVLPLAPACEVAAEMVGNEVVVLLGDRRYRVRGWERTGAINQLKLNLMVSCGDLFYVDSFDLYLSRPRLLFARHAAMDLGVSEEVIRKDLGRLLLQLEALRDAQVQNTETDKVPKASEEEEAQALALLRDPDLVGQILSDFAGMGMVGEDTNKLMGYLACVSRKLSQPLALIIQSTSAAGKSTLMEAILKLMPEEERIQYSAMTGQSLFYMGETDLKHKILAISEEEGVAQAAYALKLLQSEGELTIASTGKDAGTGNLITREYRVEGPVMLFLTTTAIDIDEELLNRCVVLTVNESREQTQAIHVAQRRRRTLEGLKTRQQHQTILGRHRHAQRLLRRLAVVNPYADQLTFLDDKTRTRRDHEKYLTLIDSIALLHQYQREVKVLQEGERRIEYIEVERRDIELANRLANEVLGRTLDELPPQTRKLLGLIEAMVSEGCARERIKRDAYRFSRRQIREQTGWGNTQLKVHLGRLEELEYLLIHKGGRGQSLEYELLYEGQGQDGTAFLMKLMDVNALHYEGEKSGVEVNLSGLDEPQSAPGRGQVGPESGGCREAKIPAQALNDGAFAGKEWHGVPEALLVVQREESIRSGQRWGDRG